MKQTISLLLFFLSIPLLQAQNDKPYRDAYTLKLKIDSTQYYQQDIEKSPYFVKDYALQIFPGEELNIEVEIKKDTISSMKVVKNNLHPEKTMTIKFYQIDDENKTDMILTVKNPFKKTLKHKALMFAVGSDKLQPTSIIPIRPRLQNYETWGYPIFSLLLVEWEWSDE